MCPYGNNPDCFNCKLPDCKANDADIVRQQAFERAKRVKLRNSLIVQSYMSGATVSGLAERFELTDSAVCYVLRNNGIHIKRGRRVSNL